MIAILSVVTTIYGTAGSAAVLLQARTMIKRKHSGDVSLRFMSVYVGGYGLYLAYGLAIRNMSLVISDAAGLACGAITLAVAFIYHCYRCRKDDHS